MKAFGLFFTGLLFTALFTALHLEMLNDLILELPELAQLLLVDWVAAGKSLDWQFISVGAMLTGLFSIRIKKEQQF